MTSRILAVPAALMIGLLAVGCSSADSGNDDSGGYAAPASAASAPDEGDARAQDAGGDAMEGEVDGGSVAREVKQAQPQEQHVIATGTVALSVADVGATRFEVTRVSDEHRGQVFADDSESDDDGDLERSRIVIRVPTARFTDAMRDLEGLGTVRTSTRGTEDVTTQVIDVAARVRAQDAGLRRMEALLARATTIDQIIAVENQIAQRQADLDSLKSQQAYLADQTSLATITVNLTRTEVDKEEDEEESGFLAGLRSGWDALGTATTNGLEGLGTVLPFAVVLLLAGVPLWLVVRSAVRRRPRPAAADAGAATPKSG